MARRISLVRAISNYANTVNFSACSKIDLLSSDVRSWAGHAHHLPFAG